VDTLVLSSGLKMPELEAGHSPPSSSEVKDDNAPTRLHDVVFDKLKGTTLHFVEG
jgi:hypothetical protein